MTLVLAVVLAGWVGYALGPARRWLIGAVVTAVAALVEQVAEVGSAAPAAVTFLLIIAGVAGIAGLALGACLHRTVSARRRLT